VPLPACRLSVCAYARVLPHPPRTGTCGGALLTFSISTSESSFATGIRGRRSSRIADRRFQLLPDITDGPPPMGAARPGRRAGPGQQVSGLNRLRTEGHVIQDRDRGPLMARAVRTALALLLVQHCAAYTVFTVPTDMRAPAASEITHR